MSYSFTGISYLLLFFSLAFLTYRFFQYWQKQRDITSKCFLYFAVSLTTFAFVRVVSGLFFANNIRFLTFSVILVTFLEGLAAAIVAYLIINFKIPKVSPWVGFVVIFILGLGTTLLTIILEPSQPFIESSGAINWGFSITSINLHYFILRMGIILITFIPLIVIIFQQFRMSEDIYTRTRSLGLILLLSIGTIIGFLDFFLIELLKLGAISRDIVTFSLSILLFVVILLTQKPSLS